MTDNSVPRGQGILWIFIHCSNNELQFAFSHTSTCTQTGICRHAQSITALVKVQTTGFSKQMKQIVLMSARKTNRLCMQLLCMHLEMKVCSRASLRTSIGMEHGFKTGQ